jgi:hypothetical protein
MFRKPTYVLFMLLILVSLLLSGCGAQPPATVVVEVTSTREAVSTTATLTATPDLCSPANITPEIRKVHNLMREFDDISFVANITPVQNLSPLVLSLMDVRRRAEIIEVPVCLSMLRLNEVNFMNSTLSYMTAFMGGQQKDQINQAIALSQNLRTLYDAELSRLIGATYVPPSTATPAPTSSPLDATATPEAVVQPTIEGEVVTATNTGNTPANLRDAPSFDAGKIGELPVGSSARALARTEASDWLLVQFADTPQGLAWVYASLVMLDKPLNTLPVAVPGPTPTATP